MNRCDRSCNTVKDPFGRIYAPSKVEDVKLKVFNMIKWTNASSTFRTHISCESRYEFDGRKCNSRQKWNNDKCRCHYEKPIRHRACEEDCAWNPSICGFKCKKDCEIEKYLKNCECIKGFVDDLVLHAMRLRIHNRVHQSIAIE